MRTLPNPDGKRIETGPLVVGDDWPGLFLRGDDCIRLAADFEKLLDQPGEVGVFDPRRSVVYLLNLMRTVTAVEEN